jgi:hypothetical protein
MTFLRIAACALLLVTSLPAHGFRSCQKTSNERLLLMERKGEGRASIASYKEDQEGAEAEATEAHACAGHREGSGDEKACGRALPE